MIVAISSNTGFAIEQKNILLKQLITDVEAKYAIPKGLLCAVARVESNYNPLALNIQGQPFIAKSNKEAIAVIKHFRKLGITNIDVGLMQINLRWHAGEFNTLEQMLETTNNIDYAGKLLAQFYKQYGSWNVALRYYHSRNHQHYAKYSRKILVSWLTN